MQDALRGDTSRLSSTDIPRIESGDALVVPNERTDCCCRARGRLQVQPDPRLQPNGGAPSGHNLFLDLEAGASYEQFDYSLQDNRGSAYGRVALHAIHRYSERTSTVLSPTGKTSSTRSITDRISH
jgi:hypothetical protein